MSLPIRLLLVGDPEDMELITRELREGGYKASCASAKTMRGVRTKLDDGSWDVVMADPTIDGLDLKEVAKAIDERRLAAPFIVFAESADEKAVLAAVEAGACRFAVRDKFGGLALAIRRELAKAEERARDREVGSRSSDSERRFRTLAESERFMADMFASIQDGISILDSDLNIVRVNPSIEGWYAHATPLAGKKCHEAYHGRDEPCEICPSLRALDTGEGAHDEVPKRGPGGEIAGWLDLFSFPLVDSSTGRTTGVIEYVRDITDRKYAEEALRASEEHFRLMVHNVRDIMYRYRLKPTRGFEYISPSVSGVLGYTPEEHYADPNIGLRAVHPDDQSTLRRLMTSPESVASPVAVRLVAKNGETIWAEEHNVVIRDESGEPVAIEGVVRDISERKRIEELKADLVSMISHELRTPLASILGYSSLLQRSDITDSDSRTLFEKAVDKIGAQARHMNALVDGLLEVTRIESGKLRLRAESIDAEDLVRQCVDDLLAGESHEIHVKAAKDVPALHGDPARLRWAISNLVSNAVKFSPEGGTVRIDIEAEGGRVLIAVSDEGIGIEPEHVSRIFDRFSQVDMSTTRPFGGFGMGLYIAKVVVEAHGGYVEVDSEPGKGSVFTIGIPIDRPQTEQSALS